MNNTSGKGESFGTRMSDQFSGTPIEEGVVVRSGAGTYDVELIPTMGGFPVTCVCLTTVLASVVGVSDCSLPPVGANVLFTRISRKSGFGVVFGISPGLGRTVEDKYYNSYPAILSGGTSAFCNDGYMKLAKDASEQCSFNDMERPCDVYPGDHLLTNEVGVMFGLLRMLTFMKATDRAKLEMFVLDDLVRLVSGHYQHFSSLGDLQVYNDVGRMSLEFRATQHQQEYYGTEEYKAFAKPREQDREKENLTTGSEQVYDSKKQAAVSLKERIQAFIGDLGNLVHLIICCPELTEDKLRLRGGTYNHSGLFQQAVTTSGAMAVRSADTIILQRGDTIPVPVKLREPWDPAGDKAEDLDKKREAEKPYKLSESDPWAGSLTLRDQVAWLHKQIYAEFDNHEKDWHVPEENELKVPKNIYDRIDNDQTDFDKAIARKSFIGQLRDGSIVLRDAWGSEIFMRGGNIIISCPGQIEYRSGKSQVMMAGHDVCMRARESVDVSATGKDVRIKAHGNLHMAAVSKGILIQSYSDLEQKGSTKQFRFSDGGKVKFGEDVESAGIILKAERDRIFIYGWTTQIAAACYLFIETLMAGAFGAAKQNKPPGFPSDAGKIVISATNKLVHRCKNFLVSVAGRSGLRSGVGKTEEESGHLQIFGNSVVVSTGKESGFSIRANGNNLAKKDDAPIQIGKIIYEDDKKGEAKQAFKTLMDKIKEEDKEYGTNDFLKRKVYYSYDPDNPGDSQRFWINFTFRTPEQYGTSKPPEMKYAPSDVKSAGSTELLATTLDWTKKFKIYQSPWQFLYKDDPDMVPWIEEGFGGSAPWPGWGWGKTDEVFAYLEKEQNVDFWGRATKRASMKNEAEALKMGNMAQYKVMAHNAKKPNELTQ